jgi:two-component system, NarL family, sensor histidine kinase BarA
MTDMNATPPRILLVEDDPISAKMTTTLLAELGPEVTHVITGEEALDLFEQGREFDLVLMDIYLPGLNGFKTTDAIRASDNYRGRKVPIVALTSNPLMENRAQFLKTTGFADYLTKPPRKDSFIASMKKYLANRPPERVANWY